MVMEEAKSWIESGSQGRMQDLDQDISMRDSCKRLAHQRDELNIKHPLELVHELIQPHANMDSQTHQTAQPFASQTAVQRSELNHLLGNFPGGEAQNVFSYFPNPQISQMFLQPGYDSLVTDNGLGGYTWPDQDTALQQAAADLGDPLQAQTSIQLQRADHTVDDQGLRPAAPSLNDRLARLEDRIGGLEVVTQNLRNELEEKMRFFAKMEAYIISLVAWTKESKDAIDGLVAELKAAVEVVTSK
ncbi:hypothetical protein IFR04_003239 [Cadophora malorum]|uniref:Uncharacterized protein n=1 Tax=Cadophora malorum TaxID=108018 RepID=A0A8H7WEW4_9HELO|nr:hypothetical protein IFR04_003239 [Cadophora malorum]